MTNLSAILLTRNSDKTVRECLENIHDVVDEIIVIDGQSTDNTVEIVKEYTDKIYSREPKGYADPDRQFALQQCSGEWVLYIDSDERFSPAAIEFIRCRLFMRDENISCYAFPRRNYYDCEKMLYTKHAWYPDYQKRLFRRRGALLGYRVHTQVEVTGQIRNMSDNYYMIHLTPGLYSWDSLVNHHMRYAKLDAAQRPTTKFLPWRIAVIPVSFLYFASKEFVKNEGYKDGIVGLQASLFLGAYHTMVNVYTLRNLLIGRRSNPSTSA